MKMRCDGLPITLPDHKVKALLGDDASDIQRNGDTVTFTVPNSAVEHTATRLSGPRKLMGKTSTLACAVSKGWA